jgi:predicted RNA-binding protein with PUA-like domain
VSPARRAARKTPPRKNPPREAASRTSAGQAPAASRAGEPRRCWLVKSNPGSYSIADLERDGRTAWDGVRNYQARNILRDEMQPGDPVLYYHSSVEPMAIVGRARVAGPARPDASAFDRADDHYDPDSDPADPRWFERDLVHVETFAVPLDRRLLTAERALADMLLLQRGSRLSVQPVTPRQYEAVLALSARAARTARTTRA